MQSYLPSSRPHMPWLLGAALIVLVIGTVYLPVVRSGFILDDDILLTDNDLIQSPDGLYRIWCTTQPTDYWPVSNTSLWLEWRLWRTNPLGYHLTNVTLHVVASLLVWRLLDALLIPGAWLGAMLFAVHPVNVETVAWISQRKTLLATVFCLLSLLWYLWADDSSAAGRQSIFRGRWYWLSLAAGVVGILSKGSVAILPLLLLLLIWWRRQRIDDRDLVSCLPFFLVAVPLIVVNIWFQTKGIELSRRDAGSIERLLGAGFVPWFYLSKALLPIHLLLFYPLWDINPANILWWLPLLGTIGVTVLLWRWRDVWWGRSLLFAWGFFCISLVPVMGFTDVGAMRFSLVADHYQYLPIIAVVATIAAAWSLWNQSTSPSKASYRRLAAGAVVLIFAVLAWSQNVLFADERALYQTTLAGNPLNWLIHNDLGRALMDAGKYSDAERPLRQALELYPEYPEAHNNLGLVLQNEGRMQEAIEQFQEALRARPDYPLALNNLGVAFSKTGQPAQAAEHFENALTLRPRYAAAHSNLANALFRLGRVDEAIDQYRQAISINPQMYAARFNLGTALFKSGRHQEAVNELREAARLNPNAAAVWANLSLAYAQLRQIDNASEAAKRTRDLARAQGNATLATQAEDWLTQFQAAPSGDSSKPAPRADQTEPQ